MINLLLTFAPRIDSNCCVFTSPESGPWLMSSIGMQRFLLIFIMSWARDNCINIATRWKRLWRVKIWKCRITPVEWNSHSISYKVIKMFDIFSLKEEVLSHSVVYCRMLSAFLKIDLSFSNKLFNTVPVTESLYLECKVYLWSLKLLDVQRKQYN